MNNNNYNGDCSATPVQDPILKIKQAYKQDKLLTTSRVQSIAGHVIYGRSEWHTASNNLLMMPEDVFCAESVRLAVIVLHVLN